MARRKADEDTNFGDMTSIERMLYGNVEDDADLEAELLALQGEMGDFEDEEIETQISRRPPPSSRKTTPAGPFRTAQKSSLGDIDYLARQISLEVAVDDDENDASVENDEDLLAELSGVLSDHQAPPPVPNRPTSTFDALPPKSNANPRNSSTGQSGSGLIGLLNERVENYKEAIQQAKQDSDAAKVRRLDRGLKTLSDQLKLAKSGKAINPDDILPLVAVKTNAKSSLAESAKPALSPSTPNLHTNSDEFKFPAKSALPPIPTNTGVQQASNLRAKTEDATLAMLIRRRDEYKTAALHAKQSDEKMAALKYFKICKQFDQVIEACENGQPIDLSNVPPSPSSAKPTPSPPTKTESANTKSAAPASNDGDDDDEDMTGIVVDQKAMANLCHAPPAPATVLEALQQRLEKFKSTAEKANADGDSSKARRLARIQKQYEDAIKNYKAKRPVDFDELPTPPGFGPIPRDGSAPPTAARPSSVAVPASQTAAQLPQRVSMPAGNLAPSTAGGGVRHSSAETAAGGAKGSGPSPPKQSRQEQQLNFLLERQRQFKMAALASKKRGDLAAAKNYLRQSMGFDQMIEASRNGLPVDISNTPTPPQAKTAVASMKPSVQRMSSEIHQPPGGDKEGSILVAGSREETYANLEHDLIRQVQICDQNRDYFTKLGDVAKVTNYEKLSHICKKDLESLRNGFRHGDPAPRFHYETRNFPSMQCCPDLGSDDLELVIVRGLLVKLPAGYEPKDADIFVKYELPYPKETPQTGKTHSIKGTNSPTFSQSIKLNINIKARQFLMIIKRHGIKLEVYQKGSLFRSDKLLGSTEIKLLPLETKCEIHESLDLMEGRKPVGGKLEAKIRIREPLVHKSVEDVSEKWLSIDEFIRIPTAGYASGAAVKKGLPRYN